MKLSHRICLPGTSDVVQLQKKTFLRSLSSRPNLKSFEDIPKNRGFLPAWIDLIRGGGPGYLHEHCDRRHKDLGPIFRERLGSSELIFIANTKLIQTVIANEGPRPHHNVPEAWLLYNDIKKIDRGIFFQVGEPWAKLRKAFNKVMLADASKITRFSDDILKINSDFLDSWQRQESLEQNLCDNTFVIHDIKSELCKWSIEATGLMLFGNRMGCISGIKREMASRSRADKLVKHVANMFAETSNFQVLPCKIAQKFNLSTWKRFEVASDGMIELANEFTNEFMSKAKRSNSNQSLVKDLLELRILEDDEISRSMVDLIIAAADTTSNSLQWMLYSLTKYPEVQDKLYKEVSALLDRPESFYGIKQFTPYLSAFIKEVSRLYPTAPFLARTLDHEISLDGYRVPPGVPIVFSLYTTSRMDEYFEDPLDFKPERWLRCNGESRQNSRISTAFASLPFGIGSRMCIGRRMADLEMHLLIASFVSKYQSFFAGRDDISIKLKMILGPNKPIDLKLRPRYT